MTTRKASQAAPGILGTVVRIGSLVRATHPDGSTVRLSVEQAETALDKLKHKQRWSNFEKLAGDAIESAIKGARVVEAPAALKPKKAGRSFAIGPIFDFSDMLIKAGGFELLGRLCLTVCVASAGGRSHSKFWIRLRVLKCPNGSQLLRHSEVNKLVRLSAAISDAAFAAMMEPYTRLIESVADKKVKIKLDGKFSVYMADAELFESFDRLFAEMQAGQSLRKSASRSGSLASELWRAATAVLPTLKTKPSRPTKSDDLDYFGFEDIGGYRGIVVAEYGDEEARFVGIAKGPQVASVPLKEGSSSGVVENPAARVSARIITELGSRF